jgi:hypothetical protein
MVEEIMVDFLGNDQLFRCNALETLANLSNELFEAVAWQRLGKLVTTLSN